MIDVLVGLREGVDAEGPVVGADEPVSPASVEALRQVVEKKAVGSHAPVESVSARSPLQTNSLIVISLCLFLKSIAEIINKIH